jgi:type IV pilus assembly protein PilB
VINDDIRALINKKAPYLEIRDTAIRSGLLSLREDGIVKIKAGITTISEVLRETASE